MVPQPLAFDDSLLAPRASSAAADMRPGMYAEAPPSSFQQVSFSREVRPFATSAPAPAPTPAPPPRPAPDPGLYAEAPASAMQRSRGVRGAGEFMRDMVTQPRDYINAYYGDLYGGDVFAPSYDGPGGFFAMDRAAYERGFTGPSGRQFGGPGYDVDRDYGLGAAFRDLRNDLGQRYGDSFDLRNAMVGSGVGLLAGGPVGAAIGAIAGGTGVGRRAREGFVDAVGNIFDGAGNFISNITGGDSSARQGGLGSEGGLGGMSVYSSGDVSGRGDYTEGRSSGMGVGREMDTSR